MRLLAVILIALTAGMVRAADALILIRHDRAGPNPRMGAYIYPDWILWPPEEAKGSGNGLLSVLSGLDWAADDNALRFQATGPLTWRSMGFDSLSRNGYLAARQRNLGPLPVQLVADRANGAESEALLLALRAGRPTVDARRFRAPMPHDGLVVYGALSWDDVASISARVGGRTLVVEFPPAAGERWTRFWQFEKGWPIKGPVPEDHDLGVPGLIRLRDALDLLRNPGRFAWLPDSSERWGGANRWLDHGSQTSPIVQAGLYAFAALAAFFGLLKAANEQSSPWTRVVLRAAMLAPAADALSGNLARFAGLDAWGVLFVCSLLALLGVAATLALWIRSKTSMANALFSTCLLGAGVMSFCDPIWSNFSPVLGGTPSTAAVGFWLAYMTGTFCFLASLGRKWIWVRRGAGLALVGLSCLTVPWWVGEIDSIALTVVPLAAGEGACQGLFLWVLALLPTALVSLTNGFSWRPEGLLREWSERETLNGADWVTALLSPVLLATIALLGLGCLVSNRFLAYRLKHLLREDPNRGGLAGAASATAAFSLLHPAYLTAAVIVAIGAVLVLLHEAVA